MNLNKVLSLQIDLSLLWSYKRLMTKFLQSNLGKIRMSKILVPMWILWFTFSVINPNRIQAQCTGFDVDAGPDLIICDLTQDIQLQGSVNGSYTSLRWSPGTHLSNPDVLDPFLTTRVPGKYIYKLTAEGVSTNNLITNGNFEGGNSGFSSNYAYTFVNTTEGEYFVTPNPAAWNGGFSACGDHTSGGGNMLLLNGHPVANTNFWCQTIPTVAGRMYLFEFWHTSVVASNPGQLTIKINGATVGGTRAGGLCSWERFEYCFTATSSSTQICMSESSGIRGGNDFAVDDIALFEKCMDMDEVEIEIIDLKAKIDIVKRPKCFSEAFDLTAIGSSFGPDIRYEWSSDGGRILSQNGQQARGRGSGIYTVKVIYTNGAVSCETEASIEFEADEELFGFLLADKKLNCRLDSITLKVNMATGSGDYSYRWSPDSLILLGKNTESVLVNQATNYSVTVTDNFSGCSLEIQLAVTPDTLRPIASIVGDSMLNCLRTQVHLFAPSKDSLKYNFEWILPNQSRLQDSTQIISSFPGNYRLILTDTNNHCRDTAYWNVGLDTLNPRLELGPDLEIDCSNRQFSVTNLVSNSPGNYKFHWRFDTTSLPIENSLLPKVVDSAGKVSLRLINVNNGCESIDSLFITDRRDIPFVDAGPDTLINCRNSSVQLKADVDPRDSVQFTWTTMGGNILTGSFSDSILVNQKGWYFLQVFNPKNGCINSDSVFVDVDKVLPSVVLGPDQIFACKDSVLTIDASASTSDPEITYLWKTSNGLILSGNGTPQIQAGAPGLYWLILINEKTGCSDSAMINLMADQNKPVVSISPPDTLNCIQKMIQLHATAFSNNNNSLDIVWTGPVGSVIDPVDSLHPLISHSGIYYLLVTDQTNGCTSIASIEVRIDTLAPIATAGPDQVWNCSSSQVRLHGSGMASHFDLVYNWSTSDGLILSNPNLDSILVKGPGLFSFRVLDRRNGCIAIDQLELIPDLDTPVLNIVFPDTLTCLNTQVLLQANAMAHSGSAMYFWSTTNGNILSGANTPNAMVDKAGMYRIQITDSGNFCNTEKWVTVHEDKLIPQFQILKPQELNCSNASVQLIAQITAPLSGYNLNWFTLDGNLIRGVDSLISIADKVGKYYLKMTNRSNGCENIDSVDVFENLNVPVEILIDVDQPRCTGEPGSLSILQIVGGVGPFEYFLNGKAIQPPNIPALNTGWYNLTIRDVNGCDLRRDFEILNGSTIGIQLLPSVKINEGDQYSIKPVFSIPLDSISWIQWTPSEHLSCTSCPEPEIIGLKDEKRYTITFANHHGCTATASILIEIIKREVWVPNAFSPNGDGVNDGFYPVVTEDSYHLIRSMSIYDRWGALIFSKSNFPPNLPDEGWDGRFNGTPLMPGVYVYLIELEWKNGETQWLKGDIHLIR
ncbi:MAG: gliding motility-associated C-terminal domain-containing protein [Saprospiraceae bacterium]|nr:gliding motility-associated C-terminal domain-containing protein [Saprospiraceae bacterium]